MGYQKATPSLARLRYSEKTFLKTICMFFFSVLGQYEGFNCCVHGGCWIGKVFISFSSLTLEVLTGCFGYLNTRPIFSQVPMQNICKNG